LRLHSNKRLIRPHAHLHRDHEPRERVRCGSMVMGNAVACVYMLDLFYAWWLLDCAFVSNKVAAFTRRP
jgi:hypothetical protein